MRPDRTAYLILLIMGILATRSKAVTETAAWTADRNNNGYLDAVVVSFTERLPAFATADLDRFVIEPLDQEGVQRFEVLEIVRSAATDTLFELKLREEADRYEPQSGWRLQLTIPSIVGMAGGATVAVADSASPVLWDVNKIFTCPLSEKDTFVITFSEPVTIPDHEKGPGELFSLRRDGSLADSDSLLDSATFAHRDGSFWRFTLERSVALIGHNYALLGTSQLQQFTDTAGNRTAITATPRSIRVSPCFCDSTGRENCDDVPPAFKDPEDAVMTAEEGTLICGNGAEMALLIPVWLRFRRRRKKKNC